ncbi:MAG: OstA-like protein [Flavipsychrobacter sp.]
MFSLKAILRYTRLTGLCIAVLLFSIHAFGQKTDTTKKVNIDIIHTTLFQSITTDSGTINKFIGDVQLKQGETLLFADSVYMNTATNNLEAFSHARIEQPGGTEALGDYMRYTSSKKLAYLKGNVSLTDGKAKLWCEELTYDVGTKIGVYTQGGTLQNENTIVTSNEGTYNVHTKDARFTHDVIITDPEYNINSDDLGYNTDSKLVTFYSCSVLVSGKSTLHTCDGTYDSKNEIAHFQGHSSVMNDDQYIEGDKLDYNKLTGYGNATGHVIVIDTTQHTTMYCGHAEYFKKKKILWATIKPVLKQVNGKDSLFIRADTFYSAPIPKKIDSAQQGRKVKTEKLASKKTKKKTVAPEKEQRPDIHIALAEDTTEADSSAPRYFIGYHHVLIFSDSMQGKCDSISYTQSDSNIRMIYKPIVWSRTSQITGDTIILHMDSSKLKSIYVPNNATVISQSGPAKAKMFDQVQGKTLMGYFKNNEITNMIVKPNAEVIYYSKDDKGAYLGVQEAQSEKLRILFDNQQINRILFEQDVHQKLTPMEQADIPNLKLSRFKWLIDERPKSKEELFK